MTRTADATKALKRLRCETVIRQHKRGNLQRTTATLAKFATLRTLAGIDPPEDRSPAYHLRSFLSSPARAVTSPETQLAYGQFIVADTQDSATSPGELQAASFASRKIPALLLDPYLPIPTGPVAILIMANK
jgi:hypothetical protein